MGVDKRGRFESLPVNGSEWIAAPRGSDTDRSVESAIEVESRTRDGVDGLDECKDCDTVEFRWIKMDDKAPSEGFEVTVGVRERCHNLISRRMSSIRPQGTRRARRTS